MNSFLKSSLIAAALFAASSASAQVLLNDFSAFVSPNTFFSGDWELTGSVSNSPRSTFSQGSGFYNFATASDEGDSSFAAYFLSTPVDVTGLTQIQIAAKLLAGNTSPTLKIVLFDSSFVENASALFSTASLNTSSFTTLSAAFSPSGSFDMTSIAGFQISGQSGGTDTLSFALDNLAAVAPPSVGAVPEPSTYGIFAAVALLGVIGLRRRRIAAVQAA
jgi:hypothetical protein